MLLWSGHVSTIHYYRASIKRLRLIDITNSDCSPVPDILQALSATPPLPFYFAQIPTNERDHWRGRSEYRPTEKDHVCPLKSRVLPSFSETHKVADFRTEKEEQGVGGERNRTREAAGTRCGPSARLFALITATKCLARETHSSFPRRLADDRGRYRHTADPKTTAENWNRSFTSGFTDLANHVCISGARNI